MRVVFGAHRRGPRLLGVLLVGAGFFAGAGSAGADEKSPPAPQRRPSVYVLMADYRKFCKDPTKRPAVIEQILQRGKPGATLLVKEVARELRGSTSRYQRDFYACGRLLGLKKYRAADKQKIAAWQEQVNGLRREGTLTEETAKSQGGPALASLRKALTVSRDDVLGGSDALSTRREAIVALLAVQKRCVSVQLEGKAPPAGPDPNDVMMQEEVALAMMGAPLSTVNRRIVETIWRSGGAILSAEAAGLIDLNVMRSLLGLRGLDLDVKLCRASRGHSKDMIERKFFDHTSPVPGKKTPWDRARQAGTTAGGECIQYGASTGAGANTWWFFSPAHHKLMLGDFTRAGLGKYKDHWTLMLGP